MDDSTSLGPSPPRSTVEPFPGEAAALQGEKQPADGHIADLESQLRREVEGVQPPASVYSVGLP